MVCTPSGLHRLGSVLSVRTLLGRAWEFHRILVLFTRDLRREAPRFKGVPTPEFALLLLIPLNCGTINLLCGIGWIVSVKKCEERECLKSLKSTNP